MDIHTEVVIRREFNIENTKTVVFTVDELCDIAQALDCNIDKLEEACDLEEDMDRLKGYQGMVEKLRVLSEKVIGIINDFPAQP